MIILRDLRTHALSMVFVAWATVAAAAPAPGGLIGVEVSISGKDLPQERVKMMVVDGQPGTLVRTPSGQQPGARITLVARVGLPDGAPPDAVKVPNPITLSLQVERATGTESWIEVARPRFIIAGGSSARMSTDDASAGPLEIEVSARALSESEAAAVRAGAAPVPPDPARR